MCLFFHIPRLPLSFSLLFPTLRESDCVYSIYPLCIFCISLSPYPPRLTSPSRSPASWLPFNDWPVSLVEKKASYQAHAAEAEADHLAGKEARPFIEGYAAQQARDAEAAAEKAASEVTPTVDESNAAAEKAAAVKKAAVEKAAAAFSAAGEERRRREEAQWRQAIKQADWEEGNRGKVHSYYDAR